MACAVAAALALAACSPEGGSEGDTRERVAQSAAMGAPDPAPVAAAVRAATERQASGRARVEHKSLHPTEEVAPVAAALVADNANAAGPVQRFLAVRHQMQVEAPAADLAQMWEAIKARCGQLDCLVEASELRRETTHTSGTAYLTMRVNPRDFEALASALGGQAKVLNHQTSSEDKTNEVIDVEAQIKNRSEYRDSLRELLREKGVKRTLSDLMEIRDTLSQVQAEIDAAQTQRKLLERDTAKQWVHIQFQPAQAILTGTYNPWQQAWQSSVGALAGSAQQLVMTVAALLPWVVALALVLGVPAALVGRRRARKQRALAASEANVSSA